MNKTMLALAVSTATITTGAFAAAEGKQAGSIDGTEIYSSNGNSLEIGGRAEARLSMQDGKAEDKSRVRLNFLGTTQITDELYGVGFYEGEFTTADNGDGSDLDNRYAYAGFGGTFGEMTYGKNSGALGVITDFTDIMAYHGNSAAHKIAVADRTDNMVTYKGNMDNLGFKASYRFADRDTNNGDTDFVDNGLNGYSLSAIYAISDTGLTLGAGYAEQGDEDEYMFAASYKIADLYLAGIYTDGTIDTNVDYTGYELAAAYKIDQLVLTTTYNNAEEDKVTATDSLAIDATYYFKPNFRSYISYNFNMLDKNDVGKVNAEDELALGIRYDF
ncbi:porin [Vibrio sp. TH_r3]|uniref:porin n=1 Tax=Vibrio sp. TH_r3 TaxID=3082084 RepID=UPI002953CD8E|nr:porin [Vibrio sp. TH_r3]MDV7106127.1 porin [Vibrio sp. TH_r3]